MGDQIAFALDPAASEFYENGEYDLAGEGEALPGGDGRLLRGAVRRVSYTEHRGWPRGGRLGWVGHDHREAGRQGCSSLATTSL